MAEGVLKEKTVDIPLISSFFDYDKLIDKEIKDRLVDFALTSVYHSYLEWCDKNGIDPCRFNLTLMSSDKDHMESVYEDDEGNISRTFHGIDNKRFTIGLTIREGNNFVGTIVEWGKPDIKTPIPKFTRKLTPEEQNTSIKEAKP